MFPPPRLRDPRWEGQGEVLPLQSEIRIVSRIVEELLSPALLHKPNLPKEPFTLYCVFSPTYPFPVIQFCEGCPEDPIPPFPDP
jgi:hypothetical protein